MINYIIQIVFFQVMFLAVYDLFLRKETFFKWNRLYLIATPILSFIIPLLKFESFKSVVSQEYIVMLPEVMLNPQVVIEQSVIAQETQNHSFPIFYVGLTVFALLFAYKLFKILKLIVNNRVDKKEDYNLVLLENEQTAFSFFNYIFVGKSLFEKKELQIIQHELVHSKQLHTLDLLFFELLKIVMWFNPLVYSYQNRITLIHEYISDAEVVKETDKKSYFNKLLTETFEIENISFVNQFYKHSLIKKRIMMIAKEKSQSVKQLKYLLLIPVLASMMFYVSCSENITETNSISNKEVSDSGMLLNVSDDGKSGYIQTSEGNYFFKKNADGSTQFYNKEGNKIGIEEIKGEGISIPKKNGWSVNVIKNEEIENSKSDSSEDVSFAVIDKAPQFPGCSGDEQELKDCLNRSIQKHVAQNFNTDATKNLGLSGKQKIYTQFKITKTGTIEIIGARAPHKELELEARRVVSSLPIMIPGEHNGKKVNVTYMLPIVFDIQ